MTETNETVEMEPTDTEDKDVLLADPEDYHRAQRLRTIHERRRRVHKVIDEIDRYTTSNDHAAQKNHLADAVTAYISEVETVLEDADVSVDLPDNFPFDSPHHFASSLGSYTDENGESKTAHYNQSIYLFRQVNQAFSEVKPLIEPDDSNEWDV